MASTKHASNTLRYSVTITDKEDLGSRTGFVAKLAARSAKERRGHWREWAGDLKKTAAYRKRLLEGIAYNPQPVPLRPRLLKEEQFTQYTRRTYRLQINPDEETEAFLYLPDGASVKRKVPVLLGQHEHGGQLLLGKEKLCRNPRWPATFRKYQESGYGGQPPADFFAEQGYAVFVIDQFGFGSRALWHEEDVDYLEGRKAWTAAADLRVRLRMRYEQYALHRALLVYGVTESEISLYDNRRAIDFLETIPEVDAKRLGAFGLSIGCMHTHQLAAFDTRIKASARVCWTGDFDVMMKAAGPRVMGTHFLMPGIFANCHLPELVGLSAPGAVLFLNGRQDAMYSFEAQEKARRDIAKMAKLQGRGDKMQWTYFDGPHSFFPPQQQTALDFFRKYL